MQKSCLYVETRPPAALVKPALPEGWSVKDMVAHLAAWEWRCVSLLIAAYNTDWPLKARPDVEGLTREFYQERKEWRWAEAETDFRRAHRALIQTVEQLPPKRRENILVQQTIVKEALKHYLRHLPDLKRWHEKTVAPLIK